MANAPLTDTDRLNWILEKLLNSPRYILIVLAVLGFDQSVLYPESDQTLGDSFRGAIDDRITNPPIPKTPHVKYE